MIARALAVLFALGCCAAWADEDLAFEAHAQSTWVRQLKPSFGAAYSGANSLQPGRELGYTFTSTLFLGARLGQTELYFDPELISGAPLSGLHGLGGFANGEDQRGAGREIRVYRARLFLRRAWNLAGEPGEQASSQNQVATRYAPERIVLTAGNVSVLDIFDSMDYSHDPRTQFMNWASLTYGAWDYPADARGYTWGVALEYLSPRWQARAGRFLVPAESNGLRLDRTWVQRHGDVVEFALPYTFAGRIGVARALLFRNRVSAGAFDDAIAAGTPPDVTAVRRTQDKRGFGLGTQLELSDQIGAYVRAGWSDGRTETFMFTEIDRSLALGVLAKGGLWSRPGDRIGAAAYFNALSGAHRAYLAGGGMGFFLGDGRLDYGPERILETFYSLGLTRNLALSAGYQRAWNPGYNRDRGPANIFGLRLHAEI